MKRERWQQVDQIFQSALDCPPEGRAAFLEQACADDHALRREVEVLLAAHEQGGSFIEQPALEVDAELLAYHPMSLATGTRLGPYEIQTLLGAGGMGEVYRALDTRLDRIVAIKVLRSHFSQDAERKRRLEREARAISGLNHPHICTLHDIGRQGDIDFLVMEYVVGETLAQRLEKGALPIDEMLQYAIEITDALDKAHRQGVIHRDLKPGNIMLTKPGTKLLDFGLAKLQKQDLRVMQSGISEESTRATNLTEPGTILGTFQYMAPEQLERREADARSDIFALGAVIYEMATGKKAFEGESPARQISAILEREPPPISKLRPEMPAMLDSVIQACLEKDPDERWQNAQDLTKQLKWIGEGILGSQASAQAKARFPFREWLAWLLAAGFLVVAVVSITAYVRRAPTKTQPIGFTITPPTKAKFQFFDSPVAISPDGRHLVFGVIVQSQQRSLLWVRPLASHVARPLPGTEGGTTPFWSPDGRHVGFFAEGKLKTIELSGGIPQILCEAPSRPGGTWNDDGVIIFGGSEGLQRVSTAGGPVSRVTTADEARMERYHMWPQFLPDGRHFLYLVQSGLPEVQGIYVGSLDSHDSKRLLPAGSKAAYVSPGYLLFAPEGTLMAQSFDADRLQLTGERFPVAENLWFYRGTGGGAFSVSKTGVLAYGTGGGQNSQLAWFDRGGRRLGPPVAVGEYVSLDLSPDESRVVLERLDPDLRTGDIWILDLARGVPSRFTFAPSWESWPIWSPDGQRIAFTSDRNTRGGLADIYQRATGASASEQILLRSQGPSFPTDWSLDGKLIIYQYGSPLAVFTNSDLWVLPLNDDRKKTPYVQTQFNESGGRLSPDGKWMAYASDESGNQEVYVQSFPNPGSKLRISLGGGSHPRWRRDGRELFYIASDENLMAVPIKPGPTFEAGSPKTLFETRLNDFHGTRNDYAATSDGQRFLINTRTEDKASSQIVVVTNWLEGARR
jgi:eukaryotic-like serine/threonine-protein kinase